MRKRNQSTRSKAEIAGGWKVETQPPKDEPMVDSRDLSFHTSEPETTTSGRVEQMSNTALMLLGVFGGFYLLYTWGWFIIAKEYSQINAVTAEGSGIIGGVLQQIIFWAAPFAPLTWFLIATGARRTKNTGVLAIALLLGALFLLPFPLLIGAGAQ